ncbi:hypothetical protein SORBI_3008G183000 [Sorghum bicolor]|uniref:UBC core domain-containing protein n=1 Tax=Sorghum bicolor TaxID=4558 RepID=A0A1Z5R7G1_SORBI|nr:hypothetical protein SORBI_3008G183000 [Sorghum bicolor]
MEPGMVVASSADIGGQLGIVMCTATELDLARLPSPADGNGNDDENATAPVVVARAVSPAEVRRVGGEFCVGDYVVSTTAAGEDEEAGVWLGCVVEVCLDVDVVFDDGAKCRVTWGHTGELWTTARTVNKDGSRNKDLYPGQRVGGPPGVLRASRWLKGYWKPNHGGEGTVSRVETTGVLVYWLASSSELDTATPPNLQSPCDLTLFRGNVSREYRYWGVGDRCFFRGGATAANFPGVSDDHDPELSSGAAACGVTTTTTRRAAYREWRQRLWRQRSLDDDMGRRRRPLVVASTRTTVDVEWQDGTRQRGLPSTSVVDCQGETDHELFPGQHVVRRTPATTTEAPPEEEEEEENVGVVRGYSYKDKTVRVTWGLLESEKEEETLSAYDVSSRVDDDSNMILYGDIVVRRHRQLPSPSSTSTSDASADDLSWVGQYISSDEAQCINVKWGDGNTSKDNNTGRDGSGDDSGSESDDSQDNGSTSMTRMNRIQVIIKAVFQLAGKVFAQGRMYLKIGFKEGEASRTELTATKSINNMSTHVVGDAGDVKETTTAEAGINGGVGELEGGVGSTMDDKMEADATVGDDKPFRFPQFEIMQQSPSDHHYLDNTKQVTGGQRKWTKRVQKEWKILENNNLPDTIYVRVFEDRMDLLRVVMVGASGTPYHDGLFFFDVQLPPSYPAEPPLVSYRSFGLHVNPNLYPSGTVCLSLLNTFGGQDVAELWSPEASTVLQVVVSIQGLVLTALPYYNEPAWSEAGTTMGQRNELPYSESTFLQSLQTMLHLLRRPPAGFEEFVRDHFRRRGQYVIRACEAYRRDGCLVGMLDEEGNPTEEAGSSSEPRPCCCSAGFRLALLNVLPRLVDAFASIDA